MEFRSPPYTVTVRRNPGRKAKLTNSTTRPDSSAIKEIPPFPLQDLDTCLQIPPSSLPSKPVRSDDPPSENLNVFLRIRPLDSKPKPKRDGDGGGNARSRLKMENRKKKTNDCCLVANNSRSVTLTVPAALIDLKRSKTEVYDGFSHVFSPDSLQMEVYERVMEPLVTDFIGGKSGLLAAMGPTGSGKTHTVFGCRREPGMVPLALRQIFSHDDCVGSSELSRSYYISMFEIYSERGKGERIFDLSPDGANVFRQQSTIKGLQEVMVSDVAQAESLIARGMLNRATAATNSNNQSSRSQCIINIRGTSKATDDEIEIVQKNALLTIIDLAGAERERKTGNQGARLLESSFINNTSMVFGRCLRSLLEYQKNRKMLLQKHFNDSLLTRYLRDYLEGKKRMTLILTVKPGEDDYLDTSFLLRQASPYMEIKFNPAEDLSNNPFQKRRIPSQTRIKQGKRRKCNEMEVSVIDGENSARDGHQITETEQLQELEPLQASASHPSPAKAELQRNEWIMCTFSKALWNVLKEYNKKLKISDKEVQSLRESLQKEKIRVLDLEKELKDLNSFHLRHQQSSTETSSDSTIVDNKENQLASECHNSLQICETTEGQNHVASLLTEISDVVTDSSIASVDDLKKSYQSNYQKLGSASGKAHHDKNMEGLKYLEVENPSNADKTACRISDPVVSCPQSHVIDGDDSNVLPLSLERNTLLKDDKTVTDLRLSQDEEVGCSGRYVKELSVCDKNPDSSSKPLDTKKPRRKLLPASSLLLKEINCFDMEAENPKGGRDEKKVHADERGRTQGSISLARLLRSNLYLK